MVTLFVAVERRRSRALTREGLGHAAREDGTGGRTGLLGRVLAIRARHGAAGARAAEVEAHLAAHAGLAGGGVEERGDEAGREQETQEGAAPPHRLGKPPAAGT